MEGVTLVLPYPVSANRYWRSFVPRGRSRAIVTLSDEAKAYKREVARLAMLAGIREPIAGRVEIRISLFPARPQDWAKRVKRDPLGWDDDVRCLDLDNALKVLIDALKGVAFEDDRWIRIITARRAEPDGEARVVVSIAPIRVESPQPGLI